MLYPDAYTPVRKKDPGHSAEEFLRGLEFISHASGVSYNRRGILDCLGCSIANRNGTISVPEVVECTGANQPAIRAILKRLGRTPVLTSTLEVRGPRDARPSRILYSVSDTPVGQAFKETLEAPETCKHPSTDT